MPTARALLLAFTLIFACAAPSARAQGLPDGDQFATEEISPTVEIILATGNGLLSGYNALLLYQNRRRQFAAGAAVVLGTIGLILGTRDAANYPTLDLVFGGAAILTGGAQMLRMRSMAPHGSPGAIRWGSRTVSVAGTALLPPVGRPMPALTVRVTGYHRYR